jgi:pyrimidine-nucleoside phosphorylase
VIYMIDVIARKKAGKALSEEEIRYFISGVTDGSIPDYQISALLMAIYFRGLDRHETFILTDAMLQSGERMDLSSLPGIKVDKHSTGGVGDKTS